MLSFYNPYENYGTSSATEFSVPQLWASVVNVIPGQPDAKIWAGSRYYRRHDIHINDFYFWDMSGGGIEDVALGSGKLAFAWIGDGAESAIYSHLGNPEPTNLAGFGKTNFDLRYYDWALLGGTGELGLTYSSTRSGVDSTGTKADTMCLGHTSGQGLAGRRNESLRSGTPHLDGERPGQTDQDFFTHLVVAQIHIRSNGDRRALTIGSVGSNFLILLHSSRNRWII